MQAKLFSNTDLWPSSIYCRTQNCQPGHELLLMRASCLTEQTVTIACKMFSNHLASKHMLRSDIFPDCPDIFKSTIFRNIQIHIQPQTAIVNTQKIYAHVLRKVNVHFVKYKMSSRLVLRLLTISWL